MKVHFLRIPSSLAQKEIKRLKEVGLFLGQFRIRRDGDSVLIPVKSSEESGEFDIRTHRRMSHVGSFERIADFFVIKERKGWETIMNEIIDNQKPRAVFLDRGVEGPLRLRKTERVYGQGEPEGIHRENALRYRVDLRRAYFSPRLAGMRSLIVERCLGEGKNGLVVDMYSGVGPIVIPLLKRGVRAVGFDINKDAVGILSSNMGLNGVKGNVAIADSNQISVCFRVADQVIMNNPSQSIEISRKIMEDFREGAIVHFLHIKEDEESPKFEGIKILEERRVHGYSPHSSLVYYRLRV